MSNYIGEFLIVLAHSKKTIWMIIMAFIFFIGIHIFGDIMLSRFHGEGTFSALYAPIAEKLEHRYDKLAWVTFFSCLLIAVKSFIKDRKRLLGGM